MPKRSNEFQKLIRLIEERVAPSGAIVEESAMIPDNHDGTLREVDVLVRIPAGDREIRIGIECRDHKRKADLHWIEQMKTKYETLPIDRRVAVSRRGFSAAALAKARLWNIETLSLQSAERTDWAKKTERMTIIRVEHSLMPAITVLLQSGSDLVRWSIDNAADFTMDLPHGPSTLMQFLEDLVALPGNAERIYGFKSRALEGQINLQFRFSPAKWRIRFEGNVYDVLSIAVTVVRSKTRVPAAVTMGLYNATAFTVGTGAIGEGQFTMTMTQRQGEEPRFRLEVIEGDEVVVTDDFVLVSDLPAAESAVTALQEI